MKEYLVRKHPPEGDGHWYICHLLVTRDARKDESGGFVACWVERDGGVLFFADENPHIEELPE